MPEASVHYSFELETLQRFERNLIALYYALCEQLNLKVTKKPGATEEQEETLPKGKQGFGLPNSGRLGGAQGSSGLNEPISAAKNRPNQK